MELKVGEVWETTRGRVLIRHVEKDFEPGVDLIGVFTLHQNAKMAAHDPKIKWGFIARWNCQILAPEQFRAKLGEWEVPSDGDYRKNITPERAKFRSQEISRQCWESLGVTRGTVTK